MHKNSFFHSEAQGGVYYGGTIAGPVMKELLSNVLPYLGIEPIYNEEEQKLPEAQKIEVPNLTAMKIGEAKSELQKLGLSWDVKGEGNEVARQFPEAGEKIGSGSKVILYLE